MNRIVRGTVLDNNHLLVRGYSDPVTVSLMRKINIVEAIRGIPFEDFHIFPAICADGSSATLLVNPLTIPVNCNCTINPSLTWICTCFDYIIPTGYICTGDDMACNEVWMSSLSTQLLTTVDTINLGSCYYYDDDYGHHNNVSYVNDTTIIIPNQNTLLLELIVTVNGTVDPLFNASILYLNDTTVSIKPMTMTLSSYTIMGIGIVSVQPIWLNGLLATGWSLKVSSNSSVSSTLLVNDFNTWSSTDTDHHPFIVIEFHKEIQINSVYIGFQTIGLYEGVNETALPVRIIAQTSLDGIHWILLDEFTSSVYHSEQGKHLSFSLVRTYSLTGHIGILIPMTLIPNPPYMRIASFFPLSVYVIIPITNQICENDNIILLGQGITPTTIQPSVGPGCVCTNSCVLSGRPVQPTDRCSDERYLNSIGVGGSPYELILQGIIQPTDMYQYLSATVNGTNITTPYYTTLNGSIHVWSVNDSFPVGNPTVKGWTVSYIDGTLLPPTIIIITSNGTWMQYENSSLSQRGIACPDGTHCSACGSNLRPGPLPQPFTYGPCEPSIGTSINDTNAYTFLQNGFSIKVIGLKYNRTTVQLSRGPCFDCDGLYQCITGECVTNPSDCPPPTYDCLGDGCVSISTVNSRDYQCACQVGTGGTACSEKYCVPGDPLTGQIDPALWVSCLPDGGSE